MLNTLGAQERDEFFEEHGDRVLLEGFYLFSDGATAEDNPLGRLLEPPEDDYERAKLIARYAEAVAQQAEQQFIDFKSYLAGTGRREPQWATLFTEAEQLAHLKSLRQAAMRARGRLTRAKKKVKEAIPFWMIEREQQEADDAKRKQEFLDDIESIQL